jgi:hypothetical protein
MLGSPIFSEDGSFTALAGEFQIAKSTGWKLPAQKIPKTYPPEGVCLKMGYTHKIAI